MKTNILLFCLSPIIYAEEKCPNEAIHCLYGVSAGVSKWARIVMLPKNITMTLCLNEQTPIYLEKDDVEIDQLSPNTELTWQINQCMQMDCKESRFLEIDQFFLLLENDHYIADPPNHAFAFDPNYGESCNP